MSKCTSSLFRSASRAKIIWVATVLSAANGYAQTAVTSWTLTTSNAADTTAYSPTITFQNQTSAVQTFSTSSTTYGLVSTASAAFIRRNTDSNGNGTPNQSTDNNNRSSVWEVTGTSSTNVLGTNTSGSTLADVLLNNNVLMGTNDLFSNGRANPYESNIERVDFYWAGGVVAAPTEGFTVFERGSAGVHDQFRIAVFTAVDGAGDLDTAAGTPTTYSGNVVTVNAGDYAATNLTSFSNYQILRFNGGNNLTTLDVNNTGGDSSPGIAGMFISFADLGIAAGTTVYGYSLMANDTSTTVANLTNWTNTAFYPVATPDAPGGSPNGSIDLTAFNGRLARPVPEPSTYGAVLLGACVSGWWLWRRRQPVTVHSTEA